MTAVVALGPAPVDLTGIRAGDANVVGFKLHHSGTPLDLTPYEITAQARKTATSADAVISATAEIVDAAGGEFVLRWDGDDVRDLLAGNASWSGVWDVQIASGVSVTTVASGKFAAVSDVTR